MRLSLLQKYILRRVYESRVKQFPRDTFVEFYRQKKSQVPADEQVKSVTKSIERMIDKELMVGYGMRTPHRWFIREVKLTAHGKRIAKKLRGEQQKLPLMRRVASSLNSNSS